MRLTKAVLAVVVAVGMVTAPALGDDFNPPPWRGEENTTFARWEFSTPEDPAPPDEWVNPYGGPPLADITEIDSVYFPDYEGQQGVWQLSGNIWTEILNDPIERPFKYVWVQITWSPWLGEPEDFPVVEVDPGAGPIPAIPIQHIVRGPWVISTFWIEILPNPAFEMIHIAGDVYVDELVIDTICSDIPIPPPDPPPDPIPTVSEWGVVAMTLLVLAAGTIVFRRFRAVA